ncbi:uncharacterized protein EV422DRAFT_534567 [Fimicolochytrium jonesii]|uniref:uncharacterized protein n=1 Tax=Fimicolochytrium jonesii TaxID=1396493 RepID=UPI0022FE3D89|nr:uncharacterized protein EV422DRAFT_534567 [Fimicolochytrium jonesii]KAI8819392.1 hypothetical protein EV422DRAFT_534567 [Fimicolochytrium jonesii]
MAGRISRRSSISLPNGSEPRFAPFLIPEAIDKALVEAERRQSSSNVLEGILPAHQTLTGDFYDSSRAYKQRAAERGGGGKLWEVDIVVEGVEGEEEKVSGCDEAEEDNLLNEEEDADAEEGGVRFTEPALQAAAKACQARSGIPSESLPPLPPITVERLEMRDERLTADLVRSRKAVFDLKQDIDGLQAAMAFNKHDEEQFDTVFRTMVQETAQLIQNLDSLSLALPSHTERLVLLAAQYDKDLSQQTQATLQTAAAHMAEARKARAAMHMSHAKILAGKKVNEKRAGGLAGRLLGMGALGDSRLGSRIGSKMGSRTGSASELRAFGKVAGHTDSKADVS